MSFSNSFLAAKCEPAELQVAMLAAWPTLELAEQAQEFASWDEAYDWAVPRSGYLKGAHPHDVKLIHRDGDWSVISDISLAMVDDADALAQLSRRVGRVVAATTQGTAGFAQLIVVEGGAAIRTITGVEGRTTEEGLPIPEEAGVPLAHFYLDELDTIWKRQGLSSFLEGEPKGTAIAIHVVDRTPIPEAPARPTEPKRPWWRLW